MRILFLSNYFPPEVNAPATRLNEHAKVWIKDGHDVDVLTSVPNFPEGKVYEGYENKLTIESHNGVKATRVPMYVTANKGTLKRTLSFVSFMISACWFARKIKNKPDVVVATSPQFFAAIGGYIVARLKRVPFVLEIRDLWPESIVAVGAVERNAVIRFFERIEQFLYEKADHIVVVTNAFKKFIVNRGIEAEKISVLKNGADLEAWQKPLDAGILAEKRKQLGLGGKFVASYIGTIGMAHRVDVLLEAAAQCNDPDIVFLVIGSGAKRAELEEKQKALNLSNFILLDKVPKDEIKYILALTDVSVVHLKASPLFETVIPSKIFEAMATRTPIVHGVKGESREIVVEANAGIPVEPENAGELLAAVQRLKDDDALYNQIASDGFAHVNKYYNRTHLAQQYVEILEDVVGFEKELDRVYN